MPSISYLEEPNPFEVKPYATGDGGSPEPPIRYDAGSSDGGAPHDPQRPPYSDISNDEYLSLRRHITIAQALAIVSLIFGGVFLSAVSLVIALLAYRKSTSFEFQAGSDTLRQALRRSALVAIAVGGIALALNAVALVVLYPIVMDMIQSGDYQSILASSQPAGSSSPGSGSSIWG